MALKTSKKKVKIKKDGVEIDIDVYVSEGEKLDDVGGRVDQVNSHIDAIIQQYPEIKDYEVAKYLEHSYIFGPLDYGRHFNIDDSLYVVRSRMGI